jgi:predicted transposase/invertase (TIGR01784 family)
VYQTRIKGRDGFLYILSEHQSKPDYRMVFRLLCYMVNLWKGWWDQHPKAKHLPAVIPLVFYHGKRKWKSPLRFRELFTESEAFSVFIPDFAYQLFNLRTYQDEAITLIAQPALNAVLYVFRHIFDEDFEQNIVRKLAEILSKIEDYREFTEFWNWAFRYACEARYDNKEKIVAAITEATENIEDGRVQMAAMTIAEQFRQEGKKLGISLILLKQLKKRFGNVSPVIEQKLKLSDFKILDRFGESIFDFKDLSDVEKWWEIHDRKARVQ